VVLHSLFEEQLLVESQDLDRFLSTGTESFAEALSYFPDRGQYKIGPEEYLELIRKAKAAVKIPIIGSLNGVSTGGWIDYAKKIEQARAAARHPKIHHHNVGLVCHCLPDGFDAALGFGHDRKIGLLLEQGCQTRPNHSMIVGNQDTQGGH
jgi:hypothetical protein